MNPTDLLTAHHHITRAMHGAGPDDPHRHPLTHHDARPAKRRWRPLLATAARQAGTALIALSARINPPRTNPGKTGAHETSAHVVSAP